jgi:hypothetical protein
MQLALTVLVFALVALQTRGFTLGAPKFSSLQVTQRVAGGFNTQLWSLREQEETVKEQGGKTTQNTVDLDETVREKGLEVGLWKAFTSKGNEGVKPGDLLKKYGSAYLATSISLAIVSYSICYVLVSNGVDVASLLEKVGIQGSSTAENAGTAAVAYAIHKAASPIRFPPTVVLTPVVADLLGKKPNEEGTTA